MQLSQAVAHRSCAHTATRLPTSPLSSHPPLFASCAPRALASAMSSKLLRPSSGQTAQLQARRSAQREAMLRRDAVRAALGLEDDEQEEEGEEEEQRQSVSTPKK